MSELCPNCNIELERKYRLPGTVGICPSCHKTFVKSLDRLMTREEFIERVEAEK